MKVLAVSTWFPYPPDNGSKARTYHLLRHVGMNHDVDLLALTQSDDDLRFLGDVRQFCRRVASFPEPAFRPSGVRSLAAFFSPVPRYFQSHHCPELEIALGDWARAEDYDVVLAASLGAAPYVAKLDMPVRRILDEHNIESQVIKRQWLEEKSLWRRLRRLPTWIKAQRFEAALASRFHVVTVVSERERHLFEALLPNGRGPRAKVIPNGADPCLLDYECPTKEHGVLVFTGALGYLPNYGAALHLWRDILPLVRRYVPEARVRITGRAAGVDTSEFEAAPGVELTGYVDDIRPVVASASALVVPIRLGGGTRLKILEAMALGTPVVSTRVGAEGISVADGDDILLGETAAEMANRVVRILTSPELAAKIAGNARALVRERYQWPAIAAQFERVLSGAEE